MLKAFVGDDVILARAKAHAHLAEGGHSEFERLSAESYTPGIFGSFAHQESLFGAPLPVIFDFLSEEDAVLEDFVAHVPVFAESDRLFLLIDAKPSAAFAKALKHKGVEVSEIKSPAQNERFNTFLLADALARKDKKSLWVVFERARQKGIAPEEIAGVLFWQLKALRLAQETASAKEAGMKDFPYNKAKSAARKFTKEELRNLSASIVRLYHEGHKDSDMEIGLERFVLSI